LTLDFTSREFKLEVNEENNDLFGKEPVEIEEKKEEEGEEKVVLGEG